MVGIIDKIKEEVQKGEEALKEIVEEVEEKIKGKIKKASKKPTKNDAELKKKAEVESTTGEKDIANKKKALLEKAKKLKEKLSEGEISSEDLKEQVKIKKKDMLISLEEYVKAGIYLGTKVVTPNMKPFVYRRRADGLAIFNTDLIDEKIRAGVEFLNKFAPEDIILVCKREAGWRAVKKFGELTGIRVFAKKYPAGVLTNKNLDDFFENELTIITDHWVDKNALNDTLKVHKKVLMICDTNNFSKGANQVIIGNNKSPKSLGVIFYILAREYCKARGIKAEVPELEWWTGELEDESEKKSRVRDVVAKAGLMSPCEGFGV
ncbi:MAG: 30S ribosomal protein S2 [Nanoarchaeota archaeon]|nr:30S ribosomal protein S2 [Nanoarchaeota archaeon]